MATYAVVFASESRKAIMGFIFATTVAARNEAAYDDGLARSIIWKYVPEVTPRGKFWREGVMVMMGPRPDEGRHVGP